MIFESTDHNEDAKWDILSGAVDKTFIGSGGGWEGGSAGVKVINQGEVSSKLPTKPPPPKLTLIAKDRKEENTIQKSRQSYI